MAVTKVVLFLAFASFALGDSLECLQKALSEGVPSLDIQSYNPFRVNDTLFPLYQWYYFRLQDIAWYNIPFWNVTKLDLISDDGENQQWNYSLNWSYFNITSHYDSSFEYLEGDITITIKDVSCSGLAIYRKATETAHENITSLDTNWGYSDIDVQVTNLDVWEDLVDGVVTTILKLFLGDNDDIGTLLRQEIDDEWLDKPERIAALKEWCSQY